MTCFGAISRYPLLLLVHSYLVSCGVSAAIGGAHCAFLSDLLKSDADMHNVYADARPIGIKHKEAINYTSQANTSSNLMPSQKLSERFREM